MIKNNNEPMDMRSEFEILFTRWDVTTTSLILTSMVIFMCLLVSRERRSGDTVNRMISTNST